MCKSLSYSTFDNTLSTKLFHLLLAMIASATDRELAKQVQHLKEENKIPRARIPGQIHTKPAERERLIKFGKLIGKAIEALITIVTPSTFYRWMHKEDEKKEAKNSKGAHRKPGEIGPVPLRRLSLQRLWWADGLLPSTWARQTRLKAAKGYRVKLVTAIYNQTAKAVTQRDHGVGSLQEPDVPLLHQSGLNFEQVVPFQIA